MKIGILIISIITLTACSNQKSDVIGVKSNGEYYAIDHAAKDAAIKNDGKDKMACSYRKKTGSHLKVRRCTTKSQLEKDRKNAREILDENQIRHTRTRVSQSNG